MAPQADITAEGKGKEAVKDMEVPIELVGAWRRSGLIWKGARHIDYCDVIWLQTPEWFVDMRLIIDVSAVPADAKVPKFFSRNSCFAGHTTYEAPQITWNHEIDFNANRRPDARPDSRPIQWEDGVVFEMGTATVDGEEHPFVEEWLRMTDDDVKWSAEGDANSARIEVGKWAVELSDTRPAGGFKAVRYELSAGEWKEYGTIST